MQPPSGTVTFLFTDIEGSTRRWEDDPDSMDDALVRHDAVLRDAVEQHQGYVFATGGDGFAVAFARAGEAVSAAVDIQRALRERSLLAVRIGVHTGEAVEREGDYFGPAVNRAARLMAIGHGGQILVSQATEQIVAGVELRDLGEHRLRDLSKPERVFQLCHPSLPASFSALRSLESYATNLPAQTTDFVGRDQELRETAKALGVTRVVTLTGVGGVGKTRLALQVAGEVVPEFPDGVFLVELGGMNDATAIDETVAATLLIQQQPQQSITDSLLSFLGNKRLLLIFDNCEHLLEPVARLVTHILGVAPGVRVLATSREALRIDGEQVMTVPSLALPDEAADLEQAATADAVRLFVDRAHAIRSEFVLSAENAAAVTQLCRRLDGIPLAIELAAARIRSMTPTEIAARLDQRFRLLTGGTRSSANRHQTLRSAIDWSYEALEPAERTLLARLSVCLGGFDLPAAEAIGAGDDLDVFDIDDLVGRLVDKSLVLAADQGEITRYKMLETIREYALDRLDVSGETASIRTRHAAHYSEFAQQGGAGLKGPQERAWLTRIEDELDNLRAAVTWSLASGETHLACECVCALGLQGLRIEPVVSAWAESITECAPAQNDPAYPVALAVAGYAKMGEGRPDDATELCDAALAQLEATPAPPAVACRVLSCVSAMEPGRGRNPEEHAKGWLRAAEAANDDYETACALNMVAVSQSIAGDPAAHDTAEASLRMARACGSPTAIAYCLFTTAMVDAPSNPARALDLLDESLRSADAAANTFAAITATGIRNALLIQSGHYEAAARAYLDAAQRALRYGRRDQQMVMLGSLAACLSAQGAHEPAAAIGGWVRSNGGSLDAASPGPLYARWREWIDQLPGVLGADRYATLSASGAAMTAAQILDYAQQHTPASGTVA